MEKVRIFRRPGWTFVHRIRRVPSPLVVAALAAPISVIGGGYSIGCTGSFTTTPGTISSGQTVCVRHVSASAYGTGMNTVLTVGGVSDTFTTVTAANAVAALLGAIPMLLADPVGTLRGLLGGPARP